MCIEKIFDKTTESTKLTDEIYLRHKIIEDFNNLSNLQKMLINMIVENELNEKNTKQFSISFEEVIGKFSNDIKSFIVMLEGCMKVNILYNEELKLSGIYRFITYYRIEEDDRCIFISLGGIVRKVILNLLVDKK